MSATIARIGLGKGRGGGDAPTTPPTPLKRDSTSRVVTKAQAERQGTKVKAVINDLRLPSFQATRTSEASESVEEQQAQKEREEQKERERKEELDFFESVRMRSKTRRCSRSSPPCRMLRASRWNSSAMISSSYFSLLFLLFSERGAAEPPPLLVLMRRSR